MSELAKANAALEQALSVYEQTCHNLHSSRWLELKLSSLSSEILNSFSFKGLIADPGFMVKYSIFRDLSSSPLTLKSLFILTTWAKGLSTAAHGGVSPIFMLDLGLFLVWTERSRNNIGGLKYKSYAQYGITQMKLKYLLPILTETCYSIQARICPNNTTDNTKINNNNTTQTGHNTNQTTQNHQNRSKRVKFDPNSSVSVEFIIKQVDTDRPVLTAIMTYAPMRSLAPLMVERVSKKGINGSNDNRSELKYFENSVKRVRNITDTYYCPNESHLRNKWLFFGDPNAPGARLSHKPFLRFLTNPDNGICSHWLYFVEDRNIHPQRIAHAWVMFNKNKSLSWLGSGYDLCHDGAIFGLIDAMFSRGTQIRFNEFGYTKTSTVDFYKPLKIDEVYKMESWSDYDNMITYKSKKKDDGYTRCKLDVHCIVKDQSGQICIKGHSVFVHLLKHEQFRALPKRNKRSKM